MSITVLIIGGDLRQISLAARLKTAGYTVHLAGIDPANESVSAIASSLDVCPTADVHDFPRDTRICILPLPASKNGEDVFTPLCGKTDPLSLGTFLDALPENAVIFGGNISEFTHRLAAEHGRRIIDYYRDEQLQVRNAVPTAEGAVAIALQELQTTVAGAKCSVIGFGRIGKALGMTLVRLGANVTVVARSTADRGWAKAFGCCAVPLDEYRRAPQNADIVYNTVPSLILTDEVLRRFNCRPILVELASVDGIDRAAADALGFRTIHASGLPGKVAPITAGRIIAETVLDLMPKEMCL